jgi:galactokinase
VSQRAGDEASAERAAELFRDRFGGVPEGVWLAPGRANLMGEHTDYNDGFVLPFALSQATTAAAARRTDGRLLLCSRQEPDGVLEIALDGLAPGTVTGWGAYPAGVAWALRSAGYQVPGACIAIDSDVPAGAGLSSSAALECATALALTEVALTEVTPAEVTPAEVTPAERAGAPVPRGELAAIARRAENEFVGVPSGIMDQSASLLSRAGHALLLDCRSLDRSQVPFDPAAAGSRLLLINTRARHDLSDGGYGRRRAECEEAARLLGISSLRDLTDASDTARLADPVLRRRARHVVTDNQRVLQVTGLLRGSPADRPDTYREIGRLLTQAHESLRDDFEISWPEADATVEAALAAGALGARMMGGGFGGCVLALVPERASGPVRGAVSEAYERHGWTAPEFLDAAPSDHARRLALQLVAPQMRGRYQCRYVTRRPPSRVISPSCGTRFTASLRSAWTCRRLKPRCSTPWLGCRWRSAPAAGSAR